MTGDRNDDNYIQLVYYDYHKGKSYKDLSEMV